MQHFTSITVPEEREMLIAFADLTGFTRMSEKKTSREVFDLVNSYCELTGDVIEKAGGKIIKFIGDAVLLVFPEEKEDAGIQALLELKERVESLLAKKGFQSKLLVKCHFGPVTIGPLGTRSDKRLDIIGEQVNNAALLVTKGFSLSPEAFRKSSPSTRKLFKKHTPAIRYIPVEEAHKD